MQNISPLREQTIMNNYVFSMVMREPKRIKPLLEYILGKKIHAIKVLEAEKVLKEKYESKGVRLDLYVEDEEGIIYNVEVQTTNKRNLDKRMRYYQALLDITFFPAGADYNLLRKSYVIFICSYDPYKQSRYIYTFRSRCDQDVELLFGDNAVKVVVNTKGTVGDISPELKEAITYLDSGEVTGEYSKELDEAVQDLINNEERGQEYMMLMTYAAEQRAEGKYINKVEQVRGWLTDPGELSENQMAKALRMTLSVFNNVLALIKEHPDWTDEQIAEEADWQ